MSSYFDDAIEFRKPVSFTGDAAAEQKPGTRPQHPRRRAHPFTLPGSTP